MRSVFPDEFQTARRIIKEEQETLDRAQQQANSIIADAQQQAMILADDQEDGPLPGGRPTPYPAQTDRRDATPATTRRSAGTTSRRSLQVADQHGDTRAPDARRELRPAQHHRNNVPW